MPTDEMFDSALRSVGDFAGVFEFDGDVAYFYLYDTTKAEKEKVLGAIRVFTGAPDFEADDVAISWDESESKVGLLIRGKLWAAFDAATRAAYGGNYHVGNRRIIRTEVQKNWILLHFDDKVVVLRFFSL